MAIAVTHLTTSFNLTNQNTAYSTASITPTASRLIVLCLNGRADHGGVPQDPSSVTGNSLTWTTIDSLVYRNIGAFTWGTMWVYAANTGGSPSTGTIDIDPVETQSNMSWSVFECNGTDVANGVAQCFVQMVKSTVNASGTTATVTLAAASDANNRPFMFSSADGDVSQAPGGSFTEIGDTDGHTENIGIQTEWRSDAFDTAPSTTFPGPQNWGSMGWELKASGGGGGAATISNPFMVAGFFGG